MDAEARQRADEARRIMDQVGKEWQGRIDSTQMKAEAASVDGLHTQMHASPSCVGNTPANDLAVTKNSMPVHGMPA